MADAIHSTGDGRIAPEDEPVRRRDEHDSCAAQRPVPARAGFGGDTGGVHDADGDAYFNANRDAHADFNPHANAYSDPHGHSNYNADTHPHSNRQSHAHADSNHHPNGDAHHDYDHDANSHAYLAWIFLNCEGASLQPRCSAKRASRCGITV